MKKFKLLALTFLVGTTSLFAQSADPADRTELYAADEAELDAMALDAEAYGDEDFYKILQKENEAHSEVIIYKSQNLNAATLADDKQGLEAFDKHLNDNYLKYLEDNGSLEDHSIKDEPCAWFNVIS